MKTFVVTCGLACVSLSSSLLAVETKTWTQTEMADFEKGTLTGLSLSSEGRLTLAPVVKQIFDGSVSFLWAVARDSKGNVYAGGGGLGSTKAKLFAVDPQGKVKTLAELDGLSIQAIAIDSTDRVYAATSPDGKVYRVDAAGKADVFYDPKAKYIWALTFDRTGNLYVATGDQGEIHRVTPAGAGSVFFRTEETHARSLAVDASGNLIVGTDPDGLILRVTPAGQGFVIYQAAKREITSVAVATDGSIYAAGVGNKQNPATPIPQPPPPPPAVPPGSSVRPAALPPTASTAPAVTGGSEIYRIQSDGYPRKIWSESQDLVYALAFDNRSRLIAATGNRGYLYRIDSDHSYTRLINLASTQVTALSAAADGTLYAVTGNIGMLFSIGPQTEASGVYESDVLDANAFSYWGRITAEPESQNGLIFETRSGNLNRPQQNWSPWEKLNAGRIASPAARFLQYRATLSGTAALAEADVAYQMKNVAPVIQEVEITPENYKFPAPAGPAAPGSASATLTLPQLGRHTPAASGAPAADSGNSPALTWAKGEIGARWLANDDNGDSMLFKVEIRGINETDWKLVHDKIREHYLSWDSTAFPDGKYVVRITASDAPSNPPDQALTSTLESDPFLVDNTPPEITGLTATPANGKIDLRFHAKDALSLLGQAEYSINGGDWVVVEPTTRLTDSGELDYRVQVDRGVGEMTIAVRVPDEYQNQAVAKTVVK
jgi:sugar lactone lactonase YvrE